MHSSRIHHSPQGSSASIAPRGFGLGDPHYRDAAMKGINVPPIHGWHCICARCAREMTKRV